MDPGVIMAICSHVTCAQGSTHQSPIIFQCTAVPKGSMHLNVPTGTPHTPCRLPAACPARTVLSGWMLHVSTVWYSGHRSPCQARPLTLRQQHLLREVRTCMVATTLRDPPWSLCSPAAQEPELAGSSSMCEASTRLRGWGPWDPPLQEAHPGRCPARSPERGVLAGWGC